MARRNRGVGRWGGTLRPYVYLALRELAANYVVDSRAANRILTTRNWDNAAVMAASAISGAPVGLGANVIAPASFAAIAGKRPREATGLLFSIVSGDANQTNAPANYSTSPP